MFATWLYVSRSRLGPVADAEVANIRKIAESRNPELGITGVLIFSGHHFGQFIEGPPAGLEAMKTSIYGDDRHGEIITLQAGASAHRRYGNWALAYAGRATVIDNVLSAAARDRDPKELLAYLDEFVAKLH